MGVVCALALPCNGVRACNEGGSHLRPHPVFLQRPLGASFERALKHLLITKLGLLMRASRRATPLKWGVGAQRILFIRDGRIGDMVMATGILKAIASGQPKLAVDVLASKGNAEVLTANPRVNRVIVVDKKRPRTYLQAVWRIRRTAYDAVIDSMVLSPSLTAALLMCLSGARHRIGIAGRGNDDIMTLSVAPVTAADHYIDRSAALIACFDPEPRRPVSYHPELFLTQEELREGEAHWPAARVLGGLPGTRLVVNVSASGQSKYWPVERFVATLRTVRESFETLAVLIVGLPRDLERMAQIGRETDARVAFTAHYRQMMAIVAASDLVFTADTAVTHVASAFRKPALVMFMGDGGGLFGPYGTAGRVVASDGPTLTSLEVEPVARALTELLQSRPGSGHSRAVPAIYDRSNT